MAWLGDPLVIEQLQLLGEAVRGGGDAWVEEERRLLRFGPLLRRVRRRAQLKVLLYFPENLGTDRRANARPVEALKDVCLDPQ